MVNQLLETGNEYGQSGHVIYLLLCRLFKGYQDVEEEDYNDDYANDDDGKTVENHFDSIVQVLFSLRNLLVTLARSVFQRDSYLDKSDVKEFGVGHGIFSHTNETVWKVGR